MDLNIAKQLLLQERAELADLHERVTESSDLDESMEESTGELTGLDQHLADHATDMFERQKDRSIDRGLTTKIDEIDAALERIERGEYGFCQVCGKAIDDERLEAVPATRFCREHANTGVVDRGSEVDITQELDEVPD